MEQEQILCIVYAIIGSIIGIVSLNMTRFSLLLATLLGFYFFTVLLVQTIIKKPLPQIIAGTIPVYIFPWLIVYLLLSNI